MSLEANKALVERFYDALWGGSQVEAVEDIIAADYVRHDLRPGDPPPGPEGQRAIAAMFRAAFPDMVNHLEALVAEGDLVVARWTMEGTHLGAWAGVPPTGKHVTMAGVNFFRIAGGRIVEIWNFRDDLGLREQIGVPVYAGYPASGAATDSP